MKYRNAGAGFRTRNGFWLNTGMVIDADQLHERDFKMWGYYLREVNPKEEEDATLRREARESQINRPPPVKVKPPPAPVEEAQPWDHARTAEEPAAGEVEEEAAFLDEGEQVEDEEG